MSKHYDTLYSEKNCPLESKRLKVIKTRSEGMKMITKIIQPLYTLHKSCNMWPSMTFDVIGTYQRNVSSNGTLNEKFCFLLVSKNTNTNANISRLLR